MLLYTDYQPPHFTNCPKDHTIYLEIAASNTHVNWNLNVTDNSGVTTNSNCDIDHQRLPIGFYLVTCSASDEAGNYAYCSFALTVRGKRYHRVMCGKYIIKTSAEMSH